MKKNVMFANKINFSWSLHRLFTKASFSLHGVFIFQKPRLVLKRQKIPSADRFLVPEGMLHSDETDPIRVKNMDLESGKFPLHFHEYILILMKPRTSFS